VFDRLEKAVASLHKIKLRELPKVGWLFVSASAAFNPLSVRKLARPAVDGPVVRGRHVLGRLNEDARAVGEAEYETLNLSP
jgi:hypothetical protein